MKIFSMIRVKILLLSRWQHYMGLDVRKSVFFGVSEKARFKPVSSATETCLSLVAKSRYDNVQKAYNKGTDQSACMR